MSTCWAHVNHKDEDALLKDLYHIDRALYWLLRCRVQDDGSVKCSYAWMLKRLYVSYEEKTPHSQRIQASKQKLQRSLIRLAEKGLVTLPVEKNSFSRDAVSNTYLLPFAVSKTAHDSPKTEFTTQALLDKINHLEAELALFRPGDVRADCGHGDLTPLPQIEESPIKNNNLEPKKPDLTPVLMRYAEHNDVRAENYINNNIISLSWREHILTASDKLIIQLNWQEFVKTWNRCLSQAIAQNSAKIRTLFAIACRSIKPVDLIASAEVYGKAWKAAKTAGLKPAYQKGATTYLEEQIYLDPEKYVLNTCMIKPEELLQPPQGTHYDKPRSKKPRVVDQLAAEDNL